MSTQEEPPPFSIGAVLGDSDPENMAWKRAVNAIEDRTTVLLDLLDDAVDEAERYAADRGIAVELTEIRAVVSRLRGGCLQ